MNSPPLHIVWTLANNTTAPYFNWFAERARGEKNIRFSFVVLHNEKPLMLEEMENRGCKAYWIPFDHHRRNSSMISALPKLVRLFRKLKPGIVHAHLFDDALPALIAARLAGVHSRFITKGDTGFHWYYAKKGVKYDRLNNRNATHIIALSGESRDFILSKEKAEPGKVHLVHHGVPYEKITAQNDETKKTLREKFGIASDDIVIGTISRFIEWKGYRHIIAAAEQLLKENNRLKFLFTGQGEQKNEMLQLVREKKIDNNIVFTGWIAPGDIPSLYGIMDIYLHAAQHEPFGFVIAEAMMNAVPVVSTPTGSAFDAISNGKNGILVNGQHAVELENGIRFMLSNDRRQIGENGKRTAMDMYEFETMWNNHIALYHKAAPGHP